MKDHIGGKVNSKWEHNTKRVNGMIPKDVKPSSSYLQIFYTIARKKKINKKSIENKKEYIFIYPSYVYLYINNSYN